MEHFWRPILPFDFDHSCGKGPNRTYEFLLREDVVALVGEEGRRKAITGRLSGRGRESNERRNHSYRWRNAQEKITINSNIFKIDLEQFLLILSFLHLVPEALIKHFALIQRLKIIASMNEMANAGIFRIRNTK